MIHSEVRPSPAADATAPFVCEVCGERFATAQELRRHGRSAGLVD